MQLNSRALLWGGAMGVIVLVIAAMLVPFVYVALALAVLLLVALVAVNRMREASDRARESDNEESTGRLGTLVAEPEEDYEPYDATTFDSALFTPSREATDDEVGYDDASVQYEEYVEPEAEWSTGDYGSTYTDDRATGVDEFETFESVDYGTTYDEPTETVESGISYEEYTPPSGDGAGSLAFESTTIEEPAYDDVMIDESIIEEVDASSVLADEGIIDESKVTSAESILAASQATRLQPETLSDEESNEETREILGRVAALLAKYE